MQHKDRLDAHTAAFNQYVNYFCHQKELFHKLLDNWNHFQQSYAVRKIK